MRFNAGRWRSADASTKRHSDREPSPHDQSDVPQTVIDTAPPADATVDKSNSWGTSPQKVSQHFSPASPAIPPRATHVVASSPQGRGSHNAKDPRMTKTFADFGFGGSIDDTQPVDTQTYMGQSELGIGTSAINGTCKSAVVAFSQQYFVEDSEVARKACLGEKCTVMNYRPHGHSLNHYLALTSLEKATSLVPHAWQCSKSI